MMRFWISAFVSLAAVGVFVSGCGPSAESQQNHLTQLGSEIVGMVSDAQCADSADCRYIAFGSKPCGGPWKYLIYCAQAVDTVALATKVAEYNALEKQINDASELMSDCSTPEPPVLEIVEGRCADVRGSMLHD